MFKLSNPPPPCGKNCYNSISYFESGRSLVETLGMLAIIGILSVSGISLYASAMNKHHANELIYEANKRATMVVAQAVQGRNTFSIQEFDNQTSGGIFSSEVIKWENEFGIVVNQVNYSVCQNLISLVDNKNPTITSTINPYSSLTPEKCTQNNNLIFIYSSNMNNSQRTSACVRFTPTLCIIKCSEIDGTATYTYAQEGTSCNHGTCDAYGACICESGYSGDNCDQVDTNTVCNLSTPCPQGTYCHYNGFTYAEDINVALAGKNGVCKGINGTTRYVEGLGTIRIGNEQMNWFNAYSWCNAQGMRFIPKGTGGMECYLYNSSNIFDGSDYGSGYCCAENKNCIDRDDKWEKREENGLFSPIFVQLRHVIGKGGVYHSEARNHAGKYRFDLSTGTFGGDMKANNAYPLCYSQ